MHVKRFKESSLQAYGVGSQVILVLQKSTYTLNKYHFFFANQKPHNCLYFKKTKKE